MPSPLQQILDAIAAYADNTEIPIGSRIEAMEAIGCKAFDLSDILKVQKAQALKLPAPSEA